MEDLFGGVVSIQKVNADLRHVFFCSEAVARFSVNSLIGILSPAERKRRAKRILGQDWDERVSGGGVMV